MAISCAMWDLRTEADFTIRHSGAMRSIEPGMTRASPRPETRLAEQRLLRRRLRAPVLLRRAHLTAEFGGGMPTPTRGVEHAAGKRDHVGLAGGDDLLGLLRLGNQADRHGGDAGGLLDRLRERHLVAGPERNFLQRRYAAGRRIDPVDVALLQFLRVFDGLMNVPAALDPVGAGHANADRFFFRKDGAHRIENFQREAHAVFEAAAILIGPPVGDRREELVHEIAVRAVQFERIDAKALGTPSGGDEGITDARKPRGVERERRRFALLVRYGGRGDRLPAAPGDRDQLPAVP